MTKYARNLALLCLALLVAISAAPLHAEPIRVTLNAIDGRWVLLRDGKPYVIKGIGGNASKSVAAKLGANSWRTWSADTAEAQLDEAQKLGMTVCVGIWLAPERHLHYDDPEEVARQSERVRKTVLQLKDRPALLCWSLGNETEGYNEGDNPAIWKAINNLASMVHQLDPNHPTMTVISEVGGHRIKNLNTLCPDIDIVGINAYGGAPSLPQRYKKAGGVKPFILTEFGPPGTWETKKNTWGSAPELTSTAKADWYKNAYEANVVRASDLCLGAYAFTWGFKQEATATWYGLIFPDGTRTQAVDALSELWSGTAVENRCPRIDAIAVHGEDQVAPADAVRVTLTATDPEKDPLKIEWLFCRDPADYKLGGDREESPEELPDAIVRSSATEAELKMPRAPGGYRLFAFVRDNHGGGAVANVPLLVKGKIDPASFAGKPVKLPLVLFDGSDETKRPFVASGWMGKTAAIRFDEKCESSPHSGTRCIKCEFHSEDQFGGVVWQSPANDWGDRPGGRNLTGAKRLTFWARGEAGGEKVKFQFGLLGKNKTFHDTDSGAIELTLTKAWKPYTIDLAGNDLSCIKTAFAWSVGGQGKPVVFYLDDIQYE